MSLENVEKFYEVLKTDAAMAASLKQQVEPLAQDLPKAAGLIAEFACSKGYEFTKEELAAFENEAQELNAEELDQVSGGFPNNVCILSGFGKGETPWSKCKIIGGGLSFPL